MPNRKRAPDIVSELMEGQTTSKPVNQRTSKPASKNAAAPSEASNTIKATFYLSPGVIGALERLWMKRREEADMRERGRITKSLLVEEALTLLCLSKQ